MTSESAQTTTVTPGVHADFDARGKLLGLEVIEATEVLGKRVQFEVALSSVAVGKAGEDN